MDQSAPPPSFGRLAYLVERPLRWTVLCVVCIVLLNLAQRSCASELRRSAIVKAVQQARHSIVNIRGQKTIKNQNHAAGTDGSKQVNGMGTGVIVDPRGYILTNYHVVDGVSTINVTLADGKRYVAKPISFDPATDLAIIKTNTRGKLLPVIKIGTSNDLMPGETVIAVGNAYGYEHTVTRGVISALHRTVKVSDTQSYDDLIQTDASINPGNSGGPLLNIDGEMIGINVAVRVGAQGIGFALPVDKVLAVTANLLSIKRLEDKWHGIIAKSATGNTVDGIVVQSIEAGSPADRIGLRAGDIIRSVDKRVVKRLLDFETALLGRSNDRLLLHVQRHGQPLDLNFTIANAQNKKSKLSNRTWTVLGLKLEPIAGQHIRSRHSRYRGGLVVTAVRPKSPAAEQGIRPGDVLVGMHIWETVSLDNVTYVLKDAASSSRGPIKFYILRGNQTLYGHLKIAASPANESRQ
ncbi:MAG: trypsin-like peptidase domain-containing protein [Planctomycetales bacterium]